MTKSLAAVILNWDSSGKIHHKIVDNNLKKDPQLWVLNPSALFLLGHQLGVLRASWGLILCSNLLKIIHKRKYVITPINTTLKNARLELVLTEDGKVAMQFFPTHPILHNSDDLEEGQRQLVSNYYYYVYSSLSEIGKLEQKALTGFVISSYLDFLQDQIDDEKITSGESEWNDEFYAFARVINRSISDNYRAPDEWENNKTMSQKDINKWIEEQTERLPKLLSDVENKYQHFCKIMSIKTM